LKTRRPQPGPEPSIWPNLGGYISQRLGFGNPSPQISHQQPLGHQLSPLGEGTTFCARVGPPCAARCGATSPDGCSVGALRATSADARVGPRMCTARGREGHAAAPSCGHAGANGSWSRMGGRHVAVHGRARPRGRWSAVFAATRVARVAGAASHTAGGG
jgi:hypothetical protein